MSDPISLSLDECVRLNERLLKCIAGKQRAELLDIVDALSVSEVKGKLKHIAESKLGSTVSKLGKYSDSEVAAAATQLKKAWQARAAAAKEEKASTAPLIPDSGPASIKVEPASNAQPSVKAEAALKAEPLLAACSEADTTLLLLHKGSGYPAPLTSSSSFSVQWRPTKSTGDAVRDQVRAKLQDCFEKGKQKNARFLRGQATDTAQMAEEAEAYMLMVFDGASKEYKARFRSLVFNLTDANNPEFIRTVVTGQLHTNDLATIEVKDMASDEVKKQRAAQAENAKMALMDEKTYKKYAGKNTDDGILKCPRCKSMKTEYVEVQTRSADEPTTKKCTCNACDYRWKFC